MTTLKEIFVQFQFSDRWCGALEYVRKNYYNSVLVP